MYHSLQSALMPFLAFLLLVVLLLGYLRLFFYWRDNRKLLRVMRNYFPTLYGLTGVLTESEVDEAVYKDSLKRSMEDYWTKRAAMPVWEREKLEEEERRFSNRRRSVIASDSSNDDDDRARRRNDDRQFFGYP